MVDASVAAKWLLPEPGSEAAAQLLEQDDLQLHVPELFDAELCNVLWKRVRRGELSDGEAVRLGAHMLDIPAERHRHVGLTDAALQCALRLTITCYDALYVVLAAALKGTLVTADVALATRVRNSGERVRIHILGAAALHPPIDAAAAAGGPDAREPNA